MHDDQFLRQYCLLMCGADAFDQCGAAVRRWRPAAPGTVCDHCGRTAEQASISAFKACGDCHGTRFCNAACSAAAWPAHKAACRAKKAEREKDRAHPPVGSIVTQRASKVLSLHAWPISKTS